MKSKEVCAQTREPQVEHKVKTQGFQESLEVGDVAQWQSTYLAWARSWAQSPTLQTIKIPVMMMMMNKR